MWKEDTATEQTDALKWGDAPWRALKNSVA
jgi:hypothetical protein